MRWTAHAERQKLTERRLAIEIKTKPEVTRKQKPKTQTVKKKKCIKKTSQKVF